jgi:hypothetical protein
MDKQTLDMDSRSCKKREERWVADFGWRILRGGFWVAQRFSAAIQAILLGPIYRSAGSAAPPKSSFPGAIPI